MRESLLLKLGEVVLKGANRKQFEGLLLRDATERLRKIGDFSIETRQSVIFVEHTGAPELADGAISEAYDAMRRVFGVVSVCRAAAVEKDMGSILAAAPGYLALELRGAKSFKVESRRSDKSFPLGSIEISKIVGSALHDAFPHLSAEMRQPEVQVSVEIREKAAYIHGNPDKGAGGLPSCSAGSAVLLLSGGIDSPVAGFMAAKRGLRVFPLHFHSYPYTSEEALGKVRELVSILRDWACLEPLRVVQFTAIQEAIARQCPAAYSTLIARRFMMDIAGRVAQRLKAGAVVTGESLGQVASQTLEGLAASDDACGSLVLRPLVGMDKEEIVVIARKIGTLDTSILPYEDCCTVFTPRHPVTKPKLEAVLQAESALDRESLIEEALSNILR